MPNNCRSSSALRHGLRGGLFIATLCGLLGLSSHPVSLASPMPVSARPLQIYFVDVEGGQATLFVTPQGKSLLIDTGWPGFNGRDADRIAAVAKLAGITKIDFVLLTHFHQDHAGGVTQLAAKIPVGSFIDHGENREPADSATGQIFRDYQAFLAKENHKRMVVKPGDELPIAGIEAKVVSGDGEVLEKPLPGAGDANPACGTSTSSPADISENAISLVVVNRRVSDAAHHDVRLPVVVVIAPGD